MKIHHIGIVSKEKDLTNFYLKPKKKFVYLDKIQNNKIILEYNNSNNLWMEFIIPLNKNSTVFNYYKKNGPSIHHFAYFTKNLEKIKKKFMKKKGYIFVNQFQTNIPCFGGDLKTAFFYNNNIFIEFLSHDKKSLNRKNNRQL